MNTSWMTSTMMGTSRKAVAIAIGGGSSSKKERTKSDISKHTQIGGGIDKQWGNSSSKNTQVRNFRDDQQRQEHMYQQ